MFGKFGIRSPQVRFAIQGLRMEVKKMKTYGLMGRRKVKNRRRKGEKKKKSIKYYINTFRFKLNF